MFQYTFVLRKHLQKYFHITRLISGKRDYNLNCLQRAQKLLNINFILEYSFICKDGFLLLYILQNKNSEVFIYTEVSHFKLSENQILFCIYSFVEKYKSFEMPSLNIIIN